jgi:hypothetical protein
VKESPKKIQPSNERKENRLDDWDSNGQTANVKRFIDIGGDEVVLVASARSRESVRSGADDNAFGNAVIVGQCPSPSHSVTELIKGMHYIITQVIQLQ